MIIQKGVIVMEYYVIITLVLIIVLILIIKISRPATNFATNFLVTIGS